MNQITSDIYKDFKPLPLSISGWNYDNRIFANLVQVMLPKTIIEVGTWQGGSAIQMAKQVQALNLDCKVYCIDTWLGSLEFWTTHADTPERDLKLINGYPSIYYQFLSNVVHSNLQDIVIPVPNTSVNAAKILQYNKIKADLIYIDGSHEYEDVKQDIINYSALLNPGGLMFGDDYGWPGVNTAVNELLPGHKVIEQNYWTWQKK